MRREVHLLVVALSAFSLGLIAMHNPEQRSSPQWWVPLMFAAGWWLKGASR